MTDKPRNRELARGEAIAKFHWSADAGETLALLEANYGITGADADAIVSEAMAIRKGHVRKRAVIGLVFSFIGLGIAVAYFGIQKFAGFVVIGFGPILMAVLALGSVVMGGRNIARIVTGAGPV